MHNDKGDGMTLFDKHLTHHIEMWNYGPGWAGYVKDSLNKLEASYPGIKAAFKAAVGWTE